jgi:hypothetical protein
VLTRRTFFEGAAVLAAVAPLTGVEAKRRPPRDAVGAASALDRERTTPAALVEAAILRLDRVNGLINAVAHPIDYFLTTGGEVDIVVRAGAGSTGAGGPYQPSAALCRRSVRVHPSYRGL